MNALRAQSTSNLGGDETSLFDLLRVLGTGWRWVVGMMLLGTLVGAGYLAVASPEFEAVALVKVGQAEPPERVAERVRLFGFQDAVLKSLGWSKDSRAKLYRSSLRATPSGAGLVRLELRAVGRDEAERAMNATIDQLFKVQGTLARAATEEARRELTNVRDEIEEARRLLETLNRLNREIPSSNHRDILTLLSMADAKKATLRNLRRRESEAKETLTSSSEEALRGAEAATESSFVAEEPASPKRTLTMIFSTIGGLFLGVALVIMRRALKLASAREF